MKPHNLIPKETLFKAYLLWRKVGTKADSLLKHALQFLPETINPNINIVPIQFYRIAVNIIILARATPACFQIIGKAMIWAYQLAITAPATAQVFAGMRAPG